MNREDVTEGKIRWLVVYDNGWQEIIEAEDLDEVYKCSTYDVLIAVRLNDHILGEADDEP